jgi:putative membrane protein insertion efficiency factor
MNRRLRLFSGCLLFCAATLWADDKAALRFILRHNPPPRAATPAPAPAALRSTSELGLAGQALVRVYQTFISPMDKPSCPFSPTCSEYAKQAVALYGLVPGMIMAADRYQRCNGLSTRYYTLEAGTRRLADPP